ncbi:Na+/H+ antiporter subunit E [candidate division KSB1 bacterium]|nr:Na+/H+ antiporter subunit E [candidate division KSB1 bacterium]
MTVQNKSRLTVFVLAVLVWAALTDIRKIEELIIGLVVAAIVSLLAGKFFLTGERRQRLWRRVGYGVYYLIHFIWEMIKANVHVAYLVIHPRVPIKPGIIKIKTNLSRETALTVLANSITLTPGTLTIDIDPAKKILYIHWIDVQSTTVEESTRQIGGRFEAILMEVFE